MLVAIVDVETTGLNPETDAVIEVAAILYSTEHRAILQQVSTLLHVDENPAESVNGINPEITFEIASLFHSEAIAKMLEASSYAVAFNSDFDRQWFSFEDNHVGESVEIPWSDAAAITYPRMGHKRDLVNLAIANGIPVVNAHRALDDCRILADLLGKVPDLEYQLARAARPKATVIALVSYDDRHLAKDAGFVWDSLVSKAWAKRMPIEDTESLPFPVAVPTVSAVVLG